MKKKRERLMWDALNANVNLVLSSQTVVNKMLDMIDTVIADIGLMDARMEMMEVRIKEMEKR